MSDDYITESGVGAPIRCERIVRGALKLLTNRALKLYSRDGTAGQSPLYKPEYCDLAHNYCLTTEST